MLKKKKIVCGGGGGGKGGRDPSLAASDRSLVRNLGRRRHVVVWWRCDLVGGGATPRVTGEARMPAVGTRWDYWASHVDVGCVLIGSLGCSDASVPTQ